MFSVTQSQANYMAAFQTDYENRVMILQELAEIIKKLGHKASPDNYNKDLNSFSLDISCPAKTII